MDKTGFVLKNVISDQITNNDAIANIIPRRRSAHGRIRQYVYHSKIKRIIRVYFIKSIFNLNPKLELKTDFWGKRFLIV